MDEMVQEEIAQEQPVSIEELFAVQPAGEAAIMDDVDNAEQPLENIEEESIPEVAQELGQPLDQEFTAAAAARPELQNTTAALRYFIPQKLNFIRLPIKQNDPMTAHAGVLSSFAQSFQPGSSLINAQKSLRVNGPVGTTQGKQTIALVKAAMTIASRASESQLRTAGIAPPRYDGILARAFPPYPRDRIADNFAVVLRNFGDNELARETLINVGSTHVGGGFMDGFTHSLLTDMQQPGANLAAEAAITQKNSLSDIAKHDNAKAIRYSRIYAPTNRFGSTPMETIARVSKQHRALNGFKPQVVDRFV